MSHKSVLQECHLDICSFSNVFAFGFVGSILFPNLVEGHVLLPWWTVSRAPGLSRAHRGVTHPVTMSHIVLLKVIVYLPFWVNLLLGNTSSRFLKQILSVFGPPKAFKFLALKSDGARHRQREGLPMKALRTGSVSAGPSVQRKQLILADWQTKVCDSARCGLVDVHRIFCRNEVCRGICNFPILVPDKKMGLGSNKVI